MRQTVAVPFRVSAPRPFGEPRGELGVAPWGYTGEWQDPTGMIYLLVMKEMLVKPTREYMRLPEQRALGSKVVILVQ